MIGKRQTMSSSKPPVQWHLKFNSTKKNFLSLQKIKIRCWYEGRCSKKSEIGVRKSVVTLKKVMNSKLEEVSPSTVVKLLKHQNAENLLSKHFDPNWGAD